MYSIISNNVVNPQNKKEYALCTNYSLKISAIMLLTIHGYQLISVLHMLEWSSAFSFYDDFVYHEADVDLYKQIDSLISMLV